MKSSEDRNRPIADLPNLGPASAKMLAKAGIKGERDLREMGSIQAFEKVRATGMNPSMNLLYSLEGALSGFKWNELPLDTRMALDMKVNFKRDLANRNQD